MWLNAGHAAHPLTERHMASVRLTEARRVYKTWAGRVAEDAEEERALALAYAKFKEAEATWVALARRERNAA